MNLTRRAAALALSALLLLPAALAAGAPTAPPLSPAQKQEDLNVLYDTLKEAHPNLFANTSEAEFLAKKSEIEAGLDTADDLTFALELQSLAALAGDSHTTVALGQTDDMHFYPFALTWFAGSWVLTTAPGDSAADLGRTVTAMNGRSMDEILAAFSTLVSADNGVKLRRQARQMFYAAEILDYLGLSSPDGVLTLTMDSGDTLALFPLSSEQMETFAFSYLADQRDGVPDTAYRKKTYYFSLPLDEQTYYIQYNVCQEDPDLPMADFAAQVAADLEAGSYAQVLLDLRNNGGGSDGVIRPLLDLLAPGVRDSSLRLYGLIGETTFSSAIINAVMIQEMGGALAGSPTSGSVDHFGSVGSFTLPHSGRRVGCSTKWIDLGTLLEAGQRYGVEPLQPDVAVEPTLADYLAGRDTEVEYLLAHGLEFTPPDRGGDPLTRGYLLSLLYNAAQAAGKDVSAPENEFYDVIPFAYYAPAADWAAQAGIAAGNGEGALEPVRPVTRAEAAVMLSRFAAYLGLSPAAQTDAFSDEDLIPVWAREAARQAGALGLLDAKSGAFRPNDAMTRSDGAALAEALLP